MASVSNGVETLPKL